MDRVSLNLRIAPDLKSRIEGYAEQLGITTTAAAVVLLDRGLSTANRTGDET